jgi:OPA family glycerol-3-phosphate transporter-like MFS transporter
MLSHLPPWLQQLLPIVLLLGAVAVVLARLPRVELGHSEAFRARRFWNWFPLGMTYAFLYMGRYNLTVAKNALGDRMTKDDFGTIFFWGTLVYGVAFLVNGPLTDRLGGRRTMLFSAVGAAAANIAMGLVLFSGWKGDLVLVFSVLYAVNMYFQSFGAVSIVKVNSYWFHVRERGVFGGIFGILISLGIYFAYDWGRLIVEHAPVMWVFFVPALVLLAFAAIDWRMVFDGPSETGHRDLDTGDATAGETGPALGVLEVARRMFSNPVIVTIALIEFCSGYLRQSIMQWYTIFAKQTGISGDFVPANWGLMLCVAGILGGVVAGFVSDHVFGSRRGPVAALLYAVMLAGSCGASFVLESPALGWLMVLMSMCIIGVHGMLSGTASMDFGGSRNTGVAVGIIDGFVYLGTALQAWILPRVLPKDGTPEAADPAQWRWWPVVMLPLALIGLVLAARLWNARPKAGSGGTPAPREPATSVAVGAGSARV